jgi:LysM repeat protein
MLRITAAVGLMITVGSSAAAAQSLSGSRAAMRRQNSVAQKQDLTFLRNSSQVRRFIASGLLVRLPGNANYEVGRVSFPYARPAVKTFIERLSGQYRAACGEKLVVTSLTRPLSRQPRNAHELSVHPTGMAADLRISRKKKCRSWLESTLKDLEAERVLDATRERRPAHYHVAVFPAAYDGYVKSLRKTAQADVTATPKSATSKMAIADAGSTQATAPPAPSGPAVRPTPESYVVRSGDSLWTIARRFGISVNALKEANQLSRNRLQPGQKLLIPTTNIVVADDDPPQA